MDLLLWASLIKAFPLTLAASLRLGWVLGIVLEWVQDLVTPLLDLLPSRP